MPKKKNLDLAAEMGEEVDVTEEQAIDAATVVAAPPMPVAQMAPIALTFEQLQSLLAAAKSDAGDNAALAAAITQGIQKTAGKREVESPAVSALNPLGDREHPRPGLKCKVSLATQDARTNAVRLAYPFEDDDLTAYEQIAINTLVPWSGVVSLMDGSLIKVSLVPTYNAIDDSLERLAIVIPAKVIEKGSHIKNMLPPITNLVEQITGHNYAKLSRADLEYFMAEHRKKNYVAVREAVAA